jgi:hypothetical protein
MRPPNGRSGWQGFVKVLLKYCGCGVETAVFDGWRKGGGLQCFDLMLKSLQL